MQLIDRTELPKPEEKITLYGVTWKEYDTLVSMFMDKFPGLRMTYLEGTLEIMGTSSVYIFSILYGLSDSNPVFILPTILIISYCICLFWSGICIGQRKNYRFSFAIAWIGLILLSIPTYGLTAVLGLITIYILTEDSVKTLYKSK